MKKYPKYLHLFTFAVISMVLAACIPQPTPEPTPIPPTATPTLVPVDAWLFTCKVDKCPVLRARGTNDSGAPIISINTGTYFVDGDVIQFYYPCIVADGSLVYCEIYRDAAGNVWQRGNYIARSKLARVY